jgi:hypothetical protein
MPDLLPTCGNQFKIVQKEDYQLHPNGIIFFKADSWVWLTSELSIS